MWRAEVARLLLSARLWKDSSNSATDRPEEPLHRALHLLVEIASVAQAKTEVKAEGFALTDVKEDLPWQHVLIFTRGP